MKVIDSVKKTAIEFNGSELTIVQTQFDSKTSSNIIQKIVIPNQHIDKFLDCINFEIGVQAE